MSLGNTRARLEREAIVDALDTHGWNVIAAAAQLGLGEDALRNRMRKHQLRPPRTVPARAPQRPRPRRLQFQRIAPRTWVPATT